VIEVPSSVRLDPPPPPSFKAGEEPTIPMLNGPLGWTAEEQAEALAQARALAEAETLPLGEALLRLWTGREKPVRPGPESNADNDFLLGWECLREVEGNEEKARPLFHDRLRPIVGYSTASKRFTTNVLSVTRKLGLYKTKP